MPTQWLSAEALASVTPKLGSTVLGIYLKLSLYLSNPNEPDELTNNEMVQLLFDDDLGESCVRIWLDHLEYHGYVSSRYRPDYEIDPTAPRDRCPKRKVYRCHYPPILSEEKRRDEHDN